jgi:hypothetical protein
MNGDGVSAVLDLAGVVGGGAELRLAHELEDVGRAAERNLWRSQVRSGASKAERKAARKELRQQRVEIASLVARTHIANSALSLFAASYVAKQMAMVRANGW